MIAIPGSKREAVHEARLLGRSDPDQKIKVSIYARQNPRPAGADAASIRALSTELPTQRRYLNQEEFNAIYGADPADIEKIVDWARAHKLQVVEQSAKMRRVLVEGAIADINRAFDVQLNEYEHPEHGHYRGREGEIHVPSELYGIIDGVFGLDTRQVGRPRLRRARARMIEWRTDGHVGSARSLAALANRWPGTFFPPQVAELYNYPANDGSNQNIAVFAFNGGSAPDPHGGYRLASLKAYFEQVLGGSTPAITDVVVQGPGNLPGPDTPASQRLGDATGEVMLDLCVVGSVAPKANIFVYFTEFTSQGWVDALHTAITDDNQISVISCSYGNPEDGPRSAWTAMGIKVVDQALEAAIAKGITICCASGDDGSSDQEPRGAHADFPASSPNVLGVGGTKLVATTSTPPKIAQETVWNEKFRGDGAGGGGVSAVFSKPSYQNNVNVPPSANPPHHIGRGVPDVAAVADPLTGVVVMHVSGQHLEPIGGTSASAPLWATLVARLNQGLHTRCGFLNEVLYTKCATGVLHDIEVGNNGAYSARAGWDACTGLGTPDGEKLLSALKA
jgi:kumamolisin